MNFFEHQAAARRRSARLVLLFALAVLGIVLAVDLVVLLAVGGLGDAEPDIVAGSLACATLTTVFVIGLGSVYRIASLREGGDAVALQLGAIAVPEHTTDFNLRRLRNVVEEMAIASGVPVPRLYVLERESAINAFAAGYSPSDAIVAVTRGALDRLNRDELQGVIAHEFSHILNGDMRLNIRLLGVLFGILMISLIGRKILEHGRLADDSKGALAVFAAALVAIVIGSIGLFFGRMIKAGVSRSRERLADASAVQFTRQASGLAGALKKIGGVGEGSRLAQRSQAEEVSHMLFGDGVGFSSWFATHPPLLDRIRALEPGFNDEKLARLAREWAAQPPSGLDEDAMLGLAEPGAPPPLPSAHQRMGVAPEQVAAQVAHPGADDYRRADAIAARMPAAVRALAAQRDAVIPLVLALLVDERSDIAQRQSGEISARLGAAVSLEVRRLHQEHVRALHPSLRLPLAAMAFPVLRLRPRPDLELFLDAANAMVYADAQVSLFEYCLARLLTVHVRESLDPSRYASFGRNRLDAVRGEVATLLAVVAQYGHADEPSARRAYLAGLHRVLPRETAPYAPRVHGVLALDDAWAPLDALDPLAKQALVEAVTVAIGHDGRMAVSEAELLRTICGVLHCPLPPMLAAAASN
jgi:Zn-dependent protease with chaperone function